MMRSIDGRAEGIPLSLSRWTDVSASPNKWEWFMAQMAQGHMVAFHPQTGIPGHWSLKPETTAGMVWWTKNPSMLIKEHAMFAGHNLKIHCTITGWEEVEKGAPKTTDAAELLVKTAELFGADNVTWRFSPVPLVENAVKRFEQIARIVGLNSDVDRVYLSFLQANDKVPETRSREERLGLITQFAEVGHTYGFNVLLCNEDSLLQRVNGLPANLSAGICQAPEDFGQEGHKRPPSEGCGCILMADPFTINESCTLGCTYCYASDKTLSDKKRNTTRTLPVLR